MDQLEAMRTFVSVATCGSFAETARRRRQSPSAITRSIAQLEDQLGLALITRTTRSLRLTESGQIYLDSCRRILDDIDDADRKVRGQSAEPRGALKIAAPILFGRLHVLPVVARLLAAHPALAVHMTLSDRNVHLVEEGVDVAVRIGDLADSSLMAVKLGAVGRVMVASPAYLQRKSPPVSPSDLAAHDIVAFESLEATNEWRFGDGAVRVEPRLVVNSADAAIAAAEAGVGITRALSYQVREAVLAGRLVPILQPFAAPPMPVSAVYPIRRMAAPNVAAFVHAAREQFKAAPLTPVEDWI